VANTTENKIVEPLSHYELIQCSLPQGGRMFNRGTSVSCIAAELQVTMRGSGLTFPAAIWARLSLADGEESFTCEGSLPKGWKASESDKEAFQAACESAFAAWSGYAVAWYRAKARCENPRGVKGRQKLQAPPDPTAPRLVKPSEDGRTATVQGK